MADERIVPVDQIERSVRREFEIDRAEVRVVRGEQIAAEFSIETGAVLLDVVDAGAEETDRLLTMKPPCSSSGKCRDEMNSAPEVGRARFGANSSVFPIWTPKGTLTESGSSHQFWPSEASERKHWPQSSKAMPQGLA